jgi:hemerythrin-like domain-containing protein
VWLWVFPPGEGEVTGVDRLFDEHPVILRVVDALSDFVDGLDSESEENRCLLVRLMTFFREYAELIHHEKEETILLPALVRAGLRWDNGVIADIRKDHELERSMLQSLRHASLQSSAWSIVDRRRVIDVCRRFIDFMRQHVALENETLRPLVSDKLDEARRAELDAHLDRFDARLTASGELQMLTELAADLGRRTTGPTPCPSADTTKK